MLSYSTQLAERHSSLGQVQLAEDEYRHALAINEHDVGTLTGLAHVVGKTEAAKLIAQALESDAADPRAVLASWKWSDLDSSDRLMGVKRLTGEHPGYLEGSLFASTLEAQAGDLSSALDRLDGLLDELPRPTVISGA